MKEIEFDCPNCKQHFEAPAEYAAQVIKCTSCESLFTVPNRRRPAWLAPCLVIIGGLCVYSIPFLPRTGRILPDAIAGMSTSELFSLTGGIVILWGIARLVWAFLKPGHGGRLAIILGIGIIVFGGVSNSTAALIIGAVVAILGGGSIALHKLKPSR